MTDTQSVPGLTPTVTLTDGYSDGNRTSLAAVLTTGSGLSAVTNNDLVNTYQYVFDASMNPLSQMSGVTQSAATGSGTNDAVASKSATFGYDDQGEFKTVNRYQGVALVASAGYIYDSDGNLTSLDYTQGTSTLDNFGWSYDTLGNVKTSSDSFDPTVTYSTDSTGQLLSDGGTNQSYVYDFNGNRQTVTTAGVPATCTTGPNNELLYDGKYSYEYDPQGNLIARWIQSPGNSLSKLTAPASGDSQITLYTWDNRNRLTSVTQYDLYSDIDGGTPMPDGDVHLRCPQSLGGRSDHAPKPGRPRKPDSSLTATRSSCNSTAIAARSLRRVRPRVHLWRPGT